MPFACVPQHVHLPDLPEVSVVASSYGSAAALRSAASATTPSLSACEEDAAAERCYALVLEVPAGQHVSVVFSSDERACLAMPIATEAPSPGGPASGDAPDAVTPKRGRRRGAAAAAAAAAAVDAAAASLVSLAQWPGACSACAAEASPSSLQDGVMGLLVEVPYAGWQFHAAPSAMAAADGAHKEEDVHPHWPRSVRFHAAGGVVPITLPEADFRMYQLLQCPQLASGNGGPLSGCLLAAAPHTRVRRAYAAARSAKELEAMTRRYAFWGWRNLFLPLLSRSTEELIVMALRPDAAPQATLPTRTTTTTTRMVCKAMQSWEVTALEEFGLACVQLHRDPDASSAYRPPFQAFAVLRTLAMTVGYALEVVQAQAQPRPGSDKGAGSATAAGGRAETAPTALSSKSGGRRARPAQQGNQTSPAADAAPSAAGSAAAPALQASMERCVWSAAVLSVAMAAAKPTYLATCAALSAANTATEPGKEESGTAITATGAAAPAVMTAPRPRDVLWSLSQLAPLQRRAMQVLASTTLAAYPVEASRLARAGAPAALAEGSPSPLPDSPSMADRVEELLNAPGEEEQGGDASAAESTGDGDGQVGAAADVAARIATRIAAFTRLVAASA